MRTYFASIVANLVKQLRWRRVQPAPRGPTYLSGSLGGARPTPAAACSPYWQSLGFILFSFSKDKTKGEAPQGTSLEIRIYNLLPLRVTSSLWGKLNSYELPVWMRSRLYHLFCMAYSCDMSEALDDDYRNYRNLGEFFRRPLKPGTRPISQEPGVVSPADGLILHIGPVIDRIKDVKDFNYSVQSFLGLQTDDHKRELLRDAENNELYHCIIYLAPGDYHRFHSPVSWTVKHRRHFPGRLLTVRPSLVERRPEVLHTNERVCYLGDWTHGFFSLTAVGATNVGSISVTFDEGLQTNQRYLWQKQSCLEHKFDNQVNLKAGQEFGHFNLGSTVVIIFEAPKGLTFDVARNQRIKFGRLMARIGPSSN